jgi:hypothetical protein
LDIRQQEFCAEAMNILLNLANKQHRVQEHAKTGACHEHRTPQLSTQGHNALDTEAP